MDKSFGGEGLTGPEADTAVEQHEQHRRYAGMKPMTLVKPLNPSIQLLEGLNKGDQALPYPSNTYIGPKA